MPPPRCAPPSPSLRAQDSLTAKLGIPLDSTGAILQALACECAPGTPPRGADGHLAEGWYAAGAAALFALCACGVWLLLRGRRGATGLQDALRDKTAR